MLGLATMVSVLFAVTLRSTLELRHSLVRLEERLQVLERNNVLGRSAVLEEQLRAMLERLEALEREATRMDTLSEERDRLEQELRRDRVDREAPPQLLRPGADREQEAFPVPEPEELPPPLPPLPPLPEP
jgi:hypothetical protein